jgi:hypothetical protein
MRTSEYQAAVIRLLEDSPIVSPQVIKDVRESVYAGEVELAFNTLREWIYEDALPITRKYYDRLAELAGGMQAEDVMASLDELVVDEAPPD